MCSSSGKKSNEVVPKYVSLVSDENYNCQWLAAKAKERLGSTDNSNERRRLAGPSFFSSLCLPLMRLIAQISFRRFRKRAADAKALAFDHYLQRAKKRPPACWNM